MSKVAAEMTDAEWAELIEHAGPEQALSIKVLRVIVKPLEDIFADEVLGKVSIGDWLRALVKAEAVMIAQSLHHFVPDDPHNAAQALEFVSREFVREVHSAFLLNCADPNPVLDELVASVADLTEPSVKVFAGGIDEIIAMLEGRRHDK